MNEVGFTAELKIKPIIQENKALDEWLIVLENLATRASENFENILNIEKKDGELEKNVDEGKKIHAKAKMLVEYIEDYASLTGVNLEQYVKQKHSSLTYVQNIFCRNKVNVKEQNQK